MQSTLEKTLDMRQSGHAWRDIGNRLGMSYESARILANAYEQLATDGRLARITAWMSANAPTQKSTVADEFGLTPDELRVLPHIFDPSLFILDRVPRADTFTEDQMIESVQRAWANLQRSEPSAKGLSHKSYNRIRRVDDPSTATLLLRYESWTDICRAAAVPPGKGARSRVYSRQWDDDALLDAVADYLDDCIATGARPTYMGYDAWQRLDPARPSGATLRQRLAKRHTGAYRGWSDIAAEAAKRRSAR